MDLRKRNKRIEELNGYIDHVASLIANENYRERDIKEFLNVIYSTAYDVGAISEHLRLKGVLDDDHGF